MTPFSFEWQWNVEYLIFMGLLYVALAIVGCGLVIAYIRTWMDVEDDKLLGKEGSSETASQYSEH